MGEGRGAGAATGAVAGAHSGTGTSTRPRGPQAARTIGKSPRTQGRKRTRTVEAMPLPAWSHGQTVGRRACSAGDVTLPASLEREPRDHASHHRGRLRTPSTMAGRNTPGKSTSQ